jgi:glycine/D-amino acid oxidase-like deaminating enzyme
MQTCDVAVIGAGIVGAACAYELASSGLRVAVVASAGATSLGFENLSILDENPGLFALTRYGLSLWDQLVEWLPAECEYWRCGALWVAPDEIQMREARRRSEFFNRERISSELLNPRQVMDAEPGLGQDVAGGLYVADDAFFQTARATEYLLRLAANKGAQTVRQSATRIREHEVNLEDGSLLYAGNIVNAAGNDAPALTPGLPFEYSSGHMLAVAAQGRCARHHIVELAAPAEVRFEALQTDGASNHAGNTAGKIAGEMWVGSSYQAATLSAASQVDPRTVALLLRRAIQMLPAIAQAKPLRSWTILRTTTADGLPLIGRIAGKEGLFVAAAYAEYGPTAALATAKLITDEILLRTPAIDPAPYLPNRFNGTIS